jgi:hypothetical protein
LIHGLSLAGSVELPQVAPLFAPGDWESKDFSYN